MLVILYQDGCEAIAARAKADIAEAFADHVEVQAVAANAPPAWPGDPAWNDLLVILYNTDGFPAAGNHFIPCRWRRSSCWSSGSPSSRRRAGGLKDAKPEASRRCEADRTMRSYGATVEPDELITDPAQLVARAEAWLRGPQ